MNNKEYASLVNQGQFPNEVRVPVDPSFIDDRGSITNVWLGNSGSVTLITSVKGSVRAKHTHLGGDWHSSYIIDGQVKYIEEENGVQQEWIFNKGDQFFTKPEVYHEMHFLTDTIFLTCNGISKFPENYERHLKRGK
jgi:quercetin dioxygenase-like cupin family protein